MAFAAVYESFTLTVAGVSREELGAPSAINALINSIVYHTLLWGLSDISNSTVSILSVADTTLSTVCTLQVCYLRLFHFFPLTDPFTPPAFLFLSRDDRKHCPLSCSFNPSIASSSILFRSF